MGVLCVQVMPLQSLHHVMPATMAHHDAQGFCPRNPDGPCVCEHHNHDGHSGEHVPEESPSSDAPTLVFTACGAPVDAPLLLSSGLVKGVLSTGTSPVVPPRPDLWSGAADPLAPQRHRADIFRPPKSHLG